MEENNDGDGDGDDDDEWWNWKEGGRERRLEQQLQLILLTVVVPHSSDGYGLWTNDTPVRGEGLALLLYDATHLTAKTPLSSLVILVGVHEPTYILGRVQLYSTKIRT